MVFEMEAGGDLTSGGSWLSEPGTYHCCITEVAEPPTNREGVPIAGSLFGITVSVLAGTVANQENKCSDITIYDPRQSEPDKASRQVKTIDKLAVACNVLSPQQVLAKAKYSLEPKNLIGQQLVIEFTPNEKNAKYPRAWDNFSHVDDPAVAAIPKNAAMIAMIDPKHRWNAAQKVVMHAPKAVKPVSPPASNPPVATPSGSMDEGSL